MIKIGTLTCLHSNNVCARVGCLKAFQNRSDFFDGCQPGDRSGEKVPGNRTWDADCKESGRENGRSHYL